MAQAAKKTRKLSLERRESMQGFVFCVSVGNRLSGFLLRAHCFSRFTPALRTMTLPLKWTGSAQEITAICSLMTRCSGNRYTIRFFYVAFSVPLTTIGSLLLAVALNQKIPGMKYFRTVFYLPAVLSGVAVYILWSMLLTPGTGLVNVALSWIGIEGPAWLTDPAWTKPAIILMKLWAVGGGMLLYLASLQGVPEQLYEAAEIDGASVLRRFWHITVPMITPVLFFELVTHIIGGFQIFQEAMSCRRT